MKASKFLLLFGILGLMTFTACDDDDDNVDPPEEENEEEIITDVVLTFTPEGGGQSRTAAAEDPDGEGPMSLEIVSDIELEANTTYTLTMELENAIEMESITEEIEEEDEEHMFFFGWSGNVFSDPAGDGNIDDRDDAVNYNDSDDNGLPLGLNTTWTTGSAGNGAFQVVLKHQPPVNDQPVKTATSTADDGESDIDLSWDVTIL